ncbi:RICIN domain-containing protein [Streptomyces sp. MP131-18]|uniref:RICIN domain-containing protein n=1 Tax=Streptomyces sp. MP131-18 TaxID=1857892 RepID=UPI00097CBBA8|nr:RICIN domain-containing protein [Streptomyces sp. MP131-18]ONK11648.1 Ricin-type beta-trefoil lectin domain protein [Streptomyces sp. MP131-18]
MFLRSVSSLRGLLAALLVAMMAGASLVALPAPRAHAAEIDTGTWYVLVNRHSGKALDVYNLATEDGAGIVQWPRNDGAWQQWQFVDSGSGQYRLRSRHSGKVLDISEWSTADGANVQQWTDGNTANQQFSVTDAGDGYIQLINRNSGKALEVWEWSTEDGARVSQFTDLDGANQQWALVPVGGSSADCGSGTYHAEATLSGSTWTARRNGGTVYTGSSMRDAMQAAINSLTPNRSSKERVVVRGSGSISAGTRVSLPSHTAIDVCGTINVTGSGSGDQAPIYSRGTTNVEVGHLNVTGSPLYGIFMRNVTDVVLGQIDLRVSSGLGIRIDNHGDRSVRSRNIRIDNVYVSGTSNHGVETYGVDGLTVGTVTARNVGYSGLLLNDTINANITRVDADNTGTGTGYAAFRMANRNGRVGDSYPTNIRVGEVIARGGGRGVFCVSESGGAVIDRVTLTNTGNNSILIENCYNVTIAGQSGTVSGGGEVRLAARSEFPGNRDITLQNMTLNNTSLRESPCGTNITYRNLTLNNTSRSTC